MKKKPKVHIIKIELYDSEVGIFEENDKQIAEAVFRGYGCKMDIGFIDKETRGLTYQKDGASPVIWVQNVRYGSTLAHEILHASWHILTNKGIKVDAENHEALAYLMSFIMERVIEKFNIIKK